MNTTNSPSVPGGEGSKGGTPMRAAMPGRPAAGAILHLDCAAHTYSGMLEHAGRDPRILGDHWTYQWRSDAVADASGWPVERLRTSLREHGASIEAWYGMREEVVHHPSTEAALSHVRQRVEAGQSATICLDLFCWERSTFAGQHHYPHRVLVTAARGEEFFVHDGLSGGTQEWMPAARLGAAMQTPDLSRADLWGFDGSNATVALTPLPGSRTDPDPGLIRDRMASTARDHLDRGEQTLRDFCAELEAYAERTDPVPDDRFLPGVAFLGAQATQRHLNAQFAELATERTGLDLAAVAENLHAAARGWNQAYVFFLFGHRKGHPLRNLTARAAGRMTEQLAHESRAAEGMLSALGA